MDPLLLRIIIYTLLFCVYIPLFYIRYPIIDNIVSLSILAFCVGTLYPLSKDKYLDRELTLCLFTLTCWYLYGGLDWGEVNFAENSLILGVSGPMSIIVSLAYTVYKEEQYWFFILQLAICICLPVNLSSIKPHAALLRYCLFLSVFYSQIFIGHLQGGLYHSKQTLMFAIPILRINEAWDWLLYLYTFCIISFSFYVIRRVNTIAFTNPVLAFLIPVSSNMQVAFPGWKKVCDQMFHSVYPIEMEKRRPDIEVTSHQALQESGEALEVQSVKKKSLNPFLDDEEEQVELPPSPPFSPFAKEPLEDLDEQFLEHSEYPEVVPPKIFQQQKQQAYVSQPIVQQHLPDAYNSTDQQAMIKPYITSVRKGTKVPRRPLFEVSVHSDKPSMSQDNTFQPVQTVQTKQEIPFSPITTTTNHQAQYIQAQYVDLLAFPYVNKNNTENQQQQPDVEQKLIPIKLSFSKKE